MKSAVVLWNRKAGTAVTQEEALRAAFDRAHIALDLRAVNDRTLLTEARLGLAAQAEGVVAAGGDGTVSAVAGVLVHAGCPKPFGVLPLGTLNHFAKDAGVPLMLDEAVAALDTGAERRVDVGEVNGRVFVNNSSLGLYPRILRDRDEQRLRLGRSKWLALMLATFSVFRRFPTLRIRVQTEAKTEYVDTPLLFVGNNQYQLDLMNLGERSRLDSGTLSLYLVKSRSRFGVIRLALLSLLGRLRQERDFSAQCLRELWVESRRRSLEVAVDGEVTRMRPPLHYRVRPGALRLMAPGLPGPVSPKSLLPL
jgi:diacylglycerol kinase family enzyme